MCEVHSECHVRFMVRRGPRVCGEVQRALIVLSMVSQMFLVLDVNDF